MNKDQALQRLTALETEAAALRAIIEAPERKSSLLKKPEPGSNEEYWRLDGYNINPMGCWQVRAGSRVAESYKHGNIFQSKELAAAYADAIETMLLLRHQPGTQPVWEDVQWVIVATGNWHICPDEWSSAMYKVHHLSPCFASKEDAQSAINNIGAERIVRMFKTFHHVGG